MGHHLNEQKQFVSDRHPSLEPNKIVLSLQDELAQDLIYEYSTRTKEKDLAEDLQTALEVLGFDDTKRLLQNDKVVEALNSIQAVYQDTIDVQARQIERQKKQLTELTVPKDQPVFKAGDALKIDRLDSKFAQETPPEFIVDHLGRMTLNVVGSTPPVITISGDDSTKTIEDLKVQVDNKPATIKKVSSTKFEITVHQPTVLIVDYMLSAVANVPIDPRDLKEEPYVMSDAEKWANDKFLATARGTAPHRAKDIVDAVDKDFSDLDE